jgi:hypothetical protein
MHDDDRVRELGQSFLWRSTGRQREIAIRQLLTESLIVPKAGGRARLLREEKPWHLFRGDASSYKVLDTRELPVLALS